MNIEDKIFNKSNFDFNKLINYGFIKEKEQWVFSENIIEDTFKIVISVDAEGKIKGKIYDLTFNEEYINFRIESITGTFVSNIRQQFVNLLNDIKEKCTTSSYFVSPQANRITAYIKEKYDVNPEFLWQTAPDYGVFRNKRSDKWFGIIMNIDKNKLDPKEKGRVEVLNVKLDEELPLFLEKPGIYPSYHMNKKSWASIILDNSLSDNEIQSLINISYEASNIDGEWIVPVNPKFFDIMNAFDKTDTILWKQSTSIQIGDIVYLYVAEPFSAIMFKCLVLKTNIPYTYEDDNLSMKKVMQIQLLKSYEQTKYPFNKLKTLGIKAIRGPRSLPKSLRNLLKEH